MVLERADRTLEETLLHDNFAGRSWDKIPRMAHHIVSATSYLHSNELVRADPKPLNVCEVDGQLGSHTQ